MTDWAQEREDVLTVFEMMLSLATGDGSKKRQAGTKPPWFKDPDHEAAIFSHLSKWKHGELVDADSGAHPLVHLAWRALAIAYQETYGQVNPRKAEAEAVVQALATKAAAGDSGPSSPALPAEERRARQELATFYR